MQAVRTIGVVIVALLVVSSLVAVAAPLPGSGESSTATSSGPTEPAEEVYTIEQAGECTEVAPFAGSEDAVSFYDYRSHQTEPVGMYSSYGTEEFQVTQSSQLFLYHGPDGTSLVIIHDRLGDGVGGGSISFTITGLPQDGAWVVEDDNYPGADDRFNHYDERSEIDWMWQPNRTDGAVFRGLDSENYDAVTIDPAFATESWGYQERDTPWEWGDTDIQAWQVRTPDGTAGGTVARDLTQDQPVTIRPGPCSADTPTPTPTETPTQTPSPTPTETPTQTPSPTPTETPVTVTTDGFELAGLVGLAGLLGYVAWRRQRER